MTKSQRRAIGQESKSRAKKTGLKCEECSGEVIRSGTKYICEQCGLTQERENLSRFISSIYFNKTKCNECGRNLQSEDEQRTQTCDRCFHRNTSE